ncbi:linear amide C-N hydrolase [Lactiplantibacillus pingfangensis]|uniref:linear amide C-N hydrolase n=1 Tax=Lactiplantibacillus pingfangensis TaxID=2559915 RepID=UPI0010F9FBBC|nr:linear amide C-N hydrolase [Lactiplantibacillus pingfangensis]
MCTSLTYTNTAEQHFFARTMDFPTTTPWRPIFLPRQHHWLTGLNTEHLTQQAILGGGRLPSGIDQILMADGVNESGISCAELYLPHAVHYAPVTQPDKINLTPQDFINWVLGEHASLAEVVADLPKVCLVNQTWHGEPYVYPFHWFLSDTTGQSLVIEPTGGPLIAQSNPSGVLTNTPVLAQHIKNLNQTLGLNDTTVTAATIAAAQTWLQTNQPLPTGSIPTNRFNHMAIRRLGTPQLTATNAQSTLFNWLDEVRLPYDPAKRHQLSHNYTHYRAVISLDQRRYAFRPRTTERLQSLQLTHEMAINWKSPMIFSAN